MKTSNIRRTLSVALAALALTGFTQVTYAASETAGETQSVGYTKTAQATQATAVAEPRRAGHGSPLTLYVEDPTGKALQLVYVEGTGWKYGAPKSRDPAGSSLYRKIAFWSTTPAPAAKDAIQSNEALTVFIDGPSGFTYVWTQDGGWKFVGTLSDRRS
jgi:hypothetical protein